MWFALQDPSEEVAREACSFWNVFVNDYNADLHPRVPALLQGILPQLVRPLPSSLILYPQTCL